jgi:hypothetical protein
MFGRTELKKLVCCLAAVDAVVWVIGSWWTGSLLGVPVPYAQWTTWARPTTPVPALSFLVTLLGGGAMFILAGALLFLIALVGAYQRPLLPRVPPE